MVVQHPFAKFWIGTLPQNTYTPYLPHGVVWIRGQLESGSSSDYLHWQVVVCLSRTQRLSWLKRVFGDQGHWEPTRSRAAEEYVQKEDTRVEGTQFELGKRPIDRSRSQV